MKTEVPVLVAEAFNLLGVHDFHNLSLAYTREDQKIMKSGEWDARNPSLVINQVKTLLEQIDLNDLGESDREWWFEILWFWYHHAVGDAIWRTRDRALAQAYANKALVLQAECQPPERGQQNRLTKLLWFLVHDRLTEAKQWMIGVPTGADPIEHANGLELIQEYERGEFF